MKSHKMFENKMFSDLWFDSGKIEFSDKNIDEILDI